MKRLLLCLLLASCATTSTKPPVNWQTVNLPNGCSINARGYQAVYDAWASQKPWFWSRILVIRYPNFQQGRINSHAICVVQWEGQIWGYDDTRGSTPLTKDLRAKTNPDYLASCWLPVTQQYDLAFFHEEE